MKKTISRKTLALIVIGGAIALAVAFGVIVGVPLVRFVSRPEEFRAWVEGHGVWGRVAYVAMVFVQVVIAVLPGEPFEIAGGYAFGAVEGSILCMLGAALGSVTVLLLVRRFGKPFVNLFFKEEDLKKLDFLKSTTGKELLFLVIFAVPGTPKDLLCYFAGLTDVPLPALILICSLGRIPSVITSTLGGDALGTQSYVAAIVVFAVTLAVSGIGLLLYNLFVKKNNQQSDSQTEAVPVGTKDSNGND